MARGRPRLALRQPDVLVAVATHNGIAHTAEWLRISQPAVPRFLIVFVVLPIVRAAGTGPAWPGPA